jgi:hypothetical protein
MRSVLFVHGRARKAGCASSAPYWLLLGQVYDFPPFDDINRCSGPDPDLESALSCAAKSLFRGNNIRVFRSHYCRFHGLSPESMRRGIETELSYKAQLLTNPR